MDILPETGRIDCAHWIPSPNFDARPHNEFINAIIIHAISLPPQVYTGHNVEAFFCNHLKIDSHSYFESITDLKVSAHFYIRRDGELVQFVATHHRAWHAGLSSLEGMQKVNDFSIGVELEGCDEHAFNLVQYIGLSNLCKALIARYPAISKRRIVGHCDIAPGRKTDPGPFFDWHKLRQSI